MIAGREEPISRSRSQCCGEDLRAIDADYYLEENSKLLYLD